MIGLMSPLERIALIAVPCPACTIWFESSAVEIAVRAAARAACAALGAPAGSPVKPKLPLVGIDSILDTAPLPNVCEPENDIASGVALGALRPPIFSASRPPHPVMPARLGDEMPDMYCCCWSLCENSCEGCATVRARYCARVVG